MLPQSTDDWALGLHSCRAVSSQPHGHSTQKKSFFATFPLTNHIPVFRGPKGSFNVRELTSLSGSMFAAPSSAPAEKHLVSSPHLLTSCPANGCRIQTGLPPRGPARAG